MERQQDTVTVTIPLSALKDIAPRALKAYVAIAHLCEVGGGSCSPSINAIAYMTGMDRRTIRGFIDEIESHGLITQNTESSHKTVTSITHVHKHDMEPEPLSGIPTRSTYFRHDVQKPDMEYKNPTSPAIPEYGEKGYDPTLLEFGTYSPPGDIDLSQIKNLHKDLPKKTVTAEEEAETLAALFANRQTRNSKRRNKPMSEKCTSVQKPDMPMSEITTSKADDVHKPDMEIQPVEPHVGNTDMEPETMSGKCTSDIASMSENPTSVHKPDMLLSPYLKSSYSIFKRREEKKELDTPQTGEVGGTGEGEPKPKTKIAYAIKKIPEIQKALDAINIESLHEQFPDLNVDEIYETFASVCLEGTPKKPGPNPYNYKNFTLALKQWLKKRQAELPDPNKPTDIQEVFFTVPQLKAAGLL